MLYILRVCITKYERSREKVNFSLAASGKENKDVSKIFGGIYSSI